MRYLILSMYSSIYIDKVTKYIQYNVKIINCNVRVDIDLSVDFVVAVHYINFMASKKISLGFCFDWDSKKQILESRVMVEHLFDRLLLISIHSEDNLLLLIWIAALLWTSILY